MQVTSCAICLEPLTITTMSDGEAADNTQTTNQLTLQCGHVFHDNCIQNWSTRADTCPVCRCPYIHTKKKSPAFTRRHTVVLMPLSSSVTLSDTENPEQEEMENVLSPHQRGQHHSTTQRATYIVLLNTTKSLMKGTLFGMSLVCIGYSLYRITTA